MISEDQLKSLVDICPKANLVTENSTQFVYLPELKITVGDDTKTLNALLCPSVHSSGSYTTRLFLSEQITERPNIGSQPANWTVHTILGKTWHSWSWNGVSENLPLVQMLLAHLGALR